VSVCSGGFAKLSLFAVHTDMDSGFNKDDSTYGGKYFSHPDIYCADAGKGLIHMTSGQATSTSLVETELKASKSVVQGSPPAFSPSHLPESLLTFGFASTRREEVIRSEPAASYANDLRSALDLSWLQGTTRDLTLPNFHPILYLTSH
jgi:hypothetical protein